MNSAHSTLEQTAPLAAELYANLYDQAGEPYIRHLRRAERNLVRLFPHASDTERHAAWLHDTIEDTGVTADLLRARGYGEQVVAIVEAVSKPADSSDYPQWIERIAASGDISAMRVKLADLTDNADPVRLAALPELRAVALRAKYLPAMATTRAGLERAGG